MAVFLPEERDGRSLKNELMCNNANLRFVSVFVL